MVIAIVVIISEAAMVLLKNTMPSDSQSNEKNEPSRTSQRRSTKKGERYCTVGQAKRGWGPAGLHHSEKNQVGHGHENTLAQTEHHAQSHERRVTSADSIKTHNNPNDARWDCYCYQVQMDGLQPGDDVTQITGSDSCYKGGCADEDEETGGGVWGEADLLGVLDLFSGGITSQISLLTGGTPF